MEYICIRPSHFVLTHVLERHVALPWRMYVHVRSRAMMRHKRCLGLGAPDAYDNMHVRIYTIVR